MKYTYQTGSLEKKQLELTVNKSNKNDIRKILGNPSTTSKFDNDVWIYIERKQTQSKIKNLGRMKIYKNDVLVLDIDQYGVLKNKEFYDVDLVYTYKNKLMNAKDPYFIWKLMHPSCNIYVNVKTCRFPEKNEKEFLDDLYKRKNENIKQILRKLV